MNNIFLFPAMVYRLYNSGVKLMIPLLIGLWLSPLLSAQNFSVGSAEFTWPDPARNNRQVQVKAFYPALTAGANTTPADGTFPSVVFGHGFVMSYTAYENLWQYFVPKGYIFLMVDMENTFSPSHENFGRDILFTGKTFQQKSQSETNFPLYQKHSGRTAFAGHSMGGGASVLAASFDPAFPDLVVGMAPAETNPSAVAAAAAVTAPYLIFAGTGDAVTPPAQHQIPIYNALGSSCKFLVSITGGAHCYYANPNTACDLGETVSGGNITLTRAEQQTKMNSVLEPLFEVFLKNLNAQLDAFESSLVQSGLETTIGCGLNTEIAEISSVSIFPNPTSGQILITGLSAEEKVLTLTDLSGKTRNIPVTESMIDLSGFSAGVYVLSGRNLRQKVVLNK